MHSVSCFARFFVVTESSVHGTVSANCSLFCGIVYLELDAAAMQTKSQEVLLKSAVVLRLPSDQGHCEYADVCSILSWRLHK